MTRFEKEEFVLLLDFLNPRNNNENMIFHEATKDSDCPAVQDIDFNLHSSSDKRGPKPEIEVVDQLFMVLTLLRNGFTLRLTSWLFNMSTLTVSRHIVTWINFIYFSIGSSISIWPF